MINAPNVPKTDMLKVANYYASLGWSVVPLPPKTKHPVIDWKKYQTQKPTTAELESWFKGKSNTDVGIGLITGKISGVVVVDEDTYKKQGDALGIDSPLKAITGRGGRHLFFTWTKGVQNSVNQGKAVDIRGDGGFIVLPPSIHENGQQYKWENKPNSGLVGILPILNIDIVKQKGLIQKFEKVNLAASLGLSEGARDDTLFRIARSLLNHNTPQDTLLILHAINNSFKPPFPAQTVQEKLTQAYGYFVGNSKESPLKIYTAPEAAKKYDELEKKYRTGISTGYQELDSFFTLMPTYLYLISATTFVGKTTLGLNICSHVAKQGKRVLFASLEQGEFVVPRIRSMTGQHQLPATFSILTSDKMPSVKDFIETIEKLPEKPELLCIDHLHYFERGNKGATEEVDRLIVDLQMLARKFELPVIVVCHLRKLNDEKTPTMDDLKDSSSLSQIPAVVALMYRLKNTQEQVSTGLPMYRNSGVVYVHKNRVRGNTGAAPFFLKENGAIVFKDDPSYEGLVRAEEDTSDFGKL